MRGILAESVDLLLADIKMPRMSGLELLKNLRRYINIPVILLTSKDDEFDELSGLKEGAD